MFKGGGKLGSSRCPATAGAGTSSSAAALMHSPFVGAKVMGQGQPLTATSLQPYGWPRNPKKSFKIWTCCESQMGRAYSSVCACGQEAPRRGGPKLRPQRPFGCFNKSLPAACECESRNLLRKWWQSSSSSLGPFAQVTFRHSDWKGCGGVKS